MTPEEITQLIAIRNRLTNRRDEMIDFAAVDEIDAVLSTVQPGTRNDIDLLLGRPCAVLPSAALAAAAAEVGVEYRWMHADTIAMLEMTRIIFEQAEPIPYD
jgi:NADH:ubiquinone oxidoreductase subunit F (NADH-binding)